MATAASDFAALSQKRKSSTWTLKQIALKVHLYLGLVWAIFLLILGITGAIIGFEQEIPRWLHARWWYVKPTVALLTEVQLIRNVERRFAPARVTTITLSPSPCLAQVMQITVPNADSASPRQPQQVFVDPYTRAILGVQTGPPRIRRSC